MLYVLGYLSHQFRFLKVAKMRKMAKSATDSEEAAALVVVSCRLSRKFYIFDLYLLQ